MEFILGPDTAQAPYFEELICALQPEMRVLLEGGRLLKQEGWGNVVEHCLLQAAIAQVLARMLKLSDMDTHRLMRTAAIHDWAKRMERNPDEFTEEEQQAGEALLKLTGYDPLLMNATKPEFYLRTKREPEMVTFLEHVQNYIDNITSHNKIVPLTERISEVSVRNPTLGEGAEYKEVLGMPFWEYVLEYQKKFERTLFTKLQEKGESIKAPEDIPRFLVEEMQKPPKQR